MDLSRFTEAHKRDYKIAYMEVKAGWKRSHWMWYIFPQIKGLGFSSTSEFYAIKSLEEAKAFLADDYLGGNLREICSVLLNARTNKAQNIFGTVDSLKLCSSMTLFYIASDGEDIFRNVLNKFFDGQADTKTLEILNK